MKREPDHQDYDEEPVTVTEETRVPMKAVIALLAGCAMFTGSAVAVGMYFGGQNSDQRALIARVDKLEDAVKKIPEMAEGIARIEGAMGTAPKK